MVKITFKSRNEEILIEAKSGETLLEAANRSGVKLFGGCSGAGVCGTCHVFINSSFLDKLDEPTFDEADLLEILPNQRINSRLACQIVISDKMDGMIVEIP
jgi:2Fe-2S ferredoxin